MRFKRTQFTILKINKVQKKYRKPQKMKIKVQKNR